MNLEPKLVVSKDSWHYQYFRFIRGLWGLQKEPARTSLCPYCQTMFWFSLAALVLSPAIILGWLMLKGMRLSYKGMSALGCNKVIDFIDWTPAGSFMEKSDDSIQSYPILTAIGTIVVTAMTLVLIFGPIFAICFGLYHVFMALPQAPGFFKMIGLYAGWGLFMGFAVIGLGLHHAWFGIHWFFTNYAMWSQIAYWTCFVLGIGVAASVLGLVSYAIASTSFGRRSIDWFMLRMNGYGEARKKARERRLEAKAKLESQPRIELPPPEPSWAVKAWRKLYSHEFKVGEKVMVVLGPIGIMWRFGWAVKRCICPMVEFVDTAPVPDPVQQPTDKPKDDSDRSDSDGN